MASGNLNAVSRHKSKALTTTPPCTLASVVSLHDFIIFDQFHVIFCAKYSHNTVMPQAITLLEKSMFSLLIWELCTCSSVLLQWPYW